MRSRLTALILLLTLAACQVSSAHLAVPSAPVVPSGTAVPSGPLSSPSPYLTPATAAAAATPIPFPSPLPSDTPTWLPPSPSPLPPTPAHQTTLLFTGVIVPARCVQAKLDEVGDPNYPYEEVRETISAADLAIGTLNATMSDITVHTGCIPTYLLVGSSNNADALAWAGFDLMSAATNHIKNCGLSKCGDQAFFDTLNNLHRVGIGAIGVGRNLAEALQPVVATVNGVRFGFVSLGQIETTTFAGAGSPGIAVLTPENLKAAIAAARQVSDVVIAMPHWGPEDSPVPNWIQRNLAKELVAAGADLVIGNHTHVVQAIQEIDGVQVFYGLGNFVFDQQLEDHQQGVILKVRFVGARFAGYELVPTHVDHDGRVHLAPPNEAQQILAALEQASQKIK